MTEDRARRESSAALLLLLGALGFAIVARGAFFETAHQVLGALVVAAGVVLLLNERGRSAAVKALIITTPLFVASLISTLLANDRSDAASTFVAIGLVAIAIAIGASVTEKRHNLAIDALIALSLIAAVTAIIGVAAHDVPWGRITGNVWRGSSSITYSNAAASVIGPAMLISTWRAMRNDSRWQACTTSLLLVGFASTQSRGGAIALLIAGVVFTVHVGVRQTVRAVLPITAGAAVGVVPLLGFASADVEARPAIVLILVAVGLVVTSVVWPIRTRIARPELPALAIAVVALIVLATTSLGNRLTLRSATTAGGPDAEVLFGDRGNEWLTAWARFTDRPIAGHGPGNIELIWTEDGRTFEALFVHNEYLEWLVTHGVIGALALVASALLAWRILRFDRRNGVLGVAVLAFLIQSGVDFLWHVPVMPPYIALIVGLWAHRPATPVRQPASSLIAVSAE